MIVTIDFRLFSEPKSKKNQNVLFDNCCSRNNRMLLYIDQLFNLIKFNLADCLKSTIINNINTCNRFHSWNFPGSVLPANMASINNELSNQGHTYSCKMLTTPPVSIQSMKNIQVGRMHVSCDVVQGSSPHPTALCLHCVWCVVYSSFSRQIQRLRYWRIFVTFLVCGNANFEQESEEENSEEKNGEKQILDKIYPSSLLKFNTFHHED